MAMPKVIQLVLLGLLLAIAINANVVNALKDSPPPPSPVTKSMKKDTAKTHKNTTTSTTVTTTKKTVTTVPKAILPSTPLASLALRKAEHGRALSPAEAQTLVVLGKKNKKLGPTISAALDLAAQGLPLSPSEVNALEKAFRATPAPAAKTSKTKSQGRKVLAPAPSLPVLPI